MKGHWDEFTTLARGLITDLEGNVVALPFRKFFNVGQTNETQLEALLQLGEPTVYEKLDGSLGILYFNSGIPHISTRGSFNSDQAKWATEWVQERNPQFSRDYTYLFEIIYPNNRIVVDYGTRSELVLLAVIHTDSGQEINYLTEAERLGLSAAKQHSFKVAELLEKAKTLSPTEEGYVLKFSDGLRVKIKGEEYVRLHRLITGFSNKSIWELLANHQPFDELLEKVPDEFYEYVRQTKYDLEQSFLNIVSELHAEWEASKMQLPTNPTRKDYAEVFKKCEHTSLLFAYLDGKPHDQMIWKMVKPKFAKPFRQDIDL